MLKKTGYIFFLILFLLGYSFFEQRNFVQKMNKDAKVLQKFYYIFNGKYLDAQPKNKNDVELMLKWTELNTGLVDELYSLSLGYDIVYDSLRKKSFLYSFGKNKKNDFIKKLLYNNKINEIGQYNINRINIYDYIFNNNDDIILVVLDDFKFKCTDYNKRHRFEFLQLFNGEKSLIELPILKDKFLNQLKEFKTELHNEDIKKSKLITLFFIYKKGKIKILCNENISKNKLENLKNKLELFFNQNDTEYFDYAFFSLKVMV